MRYEFAVPVQNGTNKEVGPLIRAEEDKALKQCAPRFGSPQRNVEEQYGAHFVCCPTSTQYSDLALVAY